MYEKLSIPKHFQHENPALMRPFKEKLEQINVKEGRAYLKAYADYLASLFEEGFDVQSLILLRSDFMDELLSRLYQHFGLSNFPYLALIAVGGYGRRELFLESDIDLLILSEINPIPDDARAVIEPFISFLWDLKLDIGSSVRSIEETIAESHRDLTIETNLIERHHITGSYLTFTRLKEALESDTCWDPRRFLRAKLREQIERHHSYKDTAYLLEPDVKNNPGGLRDIQVMQWIANFHFKARTLNDMLSLGLLAPSEFEELIECRNVLYAVRYALHITTRRPDNRLTLDSQKNVAALLGYGTEGNAPVERMMRTFFRAVRRIRELNSMALQLETLRITGHLGEDEPVYLNGYFIKRGPLIDISDPDIFSHEPWRLLEIFYLISRHDDILGLHVNALRHLRETRRSLNYYLMEVPRCRELFKKMLEDLHCLSATLPLMHEHRLLSAYMPQWENIEGLSQFDMFHSYTVDEHTIRVLKNIALFMQSQEQLHSLFRNVYRQLPEPEILAVAAFLHDIGKGQGGHHAEKGAKEALYFCQLHGYTHYQRRLVCWLVENHLLFSATALRRDIADPEVISQFARTMQDEEHLNLLYCLTVADIAATNEREWSSWKDSIFRKLYLSTRQALRQGLEAPQDLSLHVRENQQLSLMLCPRVPEEQARRLWQLLPDNYFIHYTPVEIAWHIRNIAQHKNDDPLILFAQHQDTDTEIFIWKKESNADFASVACVMARKKLNVISAEINPASDGHTLCTIKFQTQKGLCADNARLHSLRQSILQGFAASLPPVSTVSDKYFKSPFNVPTSVSFLETGCSHTHIEISTLDTPGLLAKIGIALKNSGCFILSARVTTTGERADDFFALTNAAGIALSEEEKARVRTALLEALTPPEATAPVRAKSGTAAAAASAAPSKPNP